MGIHVTQQTHGSHDAAAPQLEVFVYATSESVCTPSLVFTVQNVRTLSKAAEAPCAHHDDAVQAVQAFLGMAQATAGAGAGVAKESDRRPAKPAAVCLPTSDARPEQLSEVDTNVAQGEEDRGQVFSNDLFAMDNMDF